MKPAAEDLLVLERLGHQSFHDDEGPGELLCIARALVRPKVRPTHWKRAQDRERRCVLPQIRAEKSCCLGRVEASGVPIGVAVACVIVLSRNERSAAGELPSFRYAAAPGASEQVRRRARTGAFRCDLDYSTSAAAATAAAAAGDASANHPAAISPPTQNINATPNDMKSICPNSWIARSISLTSGTPPHSS